MVSLKLVASFLTRLAIRLVATLFRWLATLFRVASFLIVQVGRVWVALGMTLWPLFSTTSTALEYFLMDLFRVQWGFLARPLSRILAPLLVIASWFAICFASIRVWILLNVWLRTAIMQLWR